MISPLRTLLLLFYTVCICLVIMVMSPGELIILDQKTGFDVFTLDDFGSNRGKNEPEADLSFLDELQSEVDSLEERPPLAAKDSSLVENDSTPAVGTAELAEGLKEARQPIESKDGNRNHLDKFFASLSGLSKEANRVRIIHYGDSQIEGDRISGYLRERLQRRFGGCGVGMVPFKLRDNLRFTMRFESSEEWTKFGYIDSEEKPTTNQLGTLASYFKFTPEKDSAFVSKARYANVTFTDSPLGYKRNSEVEHLRMFFRNPHGELQTEINFNNKIITTQTLPISKDLSVFEYKFPNKSDFRSVKVRVASSGSPELYGFSMDCNTGIALDNVPIRGSSGVEFSKMDKATIKKLFQELDVKLIIVEFGVNVVPGMSESYSWYENQYYRQLRYFKSIVPDVDILVIGLSDMSRLRKGRYESYPNVAPIRNAQKRAAFKAGCAFWD
ncbi:MAG: hypothetical protein AAF740_06410, partial [Bacteroidota bacterium]